MQQFLSMPPHFGGYLHLRDRQVGQLFKKKYAEEEIEKKYPLPKEALLSTPARRREIL